MGREVLTLSTTGGRLWDVIHRPIGDALAQLDGGPYEFRLGGGTTLAARWHHRDSFDIDLTVDRNADLRGLASPYNPFDRAMRILGGTPEYLGRQWTISFEAGQVDLTQLDPVPAGAERRALVNGTPAMVLDNAQILHGKLERADKAAVRDVVDLIKARDLDSRALASAVNCQTRYRTEVIAAAFERANVALERDVGEQIVGAGEIQDAATLGTQAAEAVLGAVYRHVTVRTEGGLGIVEARTDSGAMHRTEMMEHEIDSKLTESGLDHYLRASAFGADAIGAALHRACAMGEGNETVWETGRRPPAGDRPGPNRNRTRDW